MPQDRLKNKQVNAKSIAIRQELDRIKNTSDWRPYHGGSFNFEFFPSAIHGADDEGKHVSSTYPGGPQMKSIQWESTVWEKQK